MKQADVISAVKNHVQAVAAGVGTAAGFAAVTAAQAAAADSIEIIDPIPIDAEPCAPIAASGLESEVQVLAYDRIPVDGGGEADVALVSVGGEEVMIADFDLDGRADMIFCDADHNGVIDPSEAMPLVDEYIDMHSLQQAVGYSELYAQNPAMQDYVNDADVDAFMA